MEDSVAGNGKINAVFIMAVISLGLAIAASSLCVSMTLKWDGILFGCGLMIMAASAHLIGKWYIISTLLNSLGCGFSIGAYYSVTSQAFNLSHAISAGIISCFILFAAWVLFRLSVKKGYVITLCGVLLTAALIFSVTQWSSRNEFIYSYNFFMLVIAAFYLIAFRTTAYNERSALKDISTASFGAFALVSFIVAVILTEGDALETLGVFDTGAGPKKQKR